MGSAASSQVELHRQVARRNSAGAISTASTGTFAEDVQAAEPGAGDPIQAEVDAPNVRTHARRSGTAALRSRIAAEKEAATVAVGDPGSFWTGASRSVQHALLVFGCVLALLVVLHVGPPILPSGDASKPTMSKRDLSRADMSGSGKIAGVLHQRRIPSLSTTPPTLHEHPMTRQTKISLSPPGARASSIRTPPYPLSRATSGWVTRRPGKSLLRLKARQ